MNNKNKERYFKTDVVASYVEVCNLSDCSFDEILEFASFVIGENVDISNLYKYRNEILSILEKDYPDLKRSIYLTTNTDVIDYDYLLGINYLNTKEKTASYYLNKYKEKYGEYILVKSINKETVKSLKKTR